jgi:hypothetical protein
MVLERNLELKFGQRCRRANAHDLVPKLHINHFAGLLLTFVEV